MLRRLHHWSARNYSATRQSIELAAGDEKLDREADALWEAWSAQCYADGQLDCYGLQTLACRELVEAGEVLLRRRPRRPSDGLAVPLQLQVIETDLLDAN